MSWTHLLRKWQNNSRSIASNKRKPRRALPRVEQLENRWLMATHLQLFNETPAVEANETVNRLFGQFTYTSGSLSNYTAVIDWGDLTSSWATLSGGATTSDPVNITGSHAYELVGSYELTVTLYYLGAEVATADTGWIVRDAPLTATFLPFTTTEGDGTMPNTVLVHFTDSGTNPSPPGYAGIIYWGDGSSNEGPITPVWDSTNNCWDILSSHMYEEAGNYTVKVVLRDGDGSEVTTQGTATVLPASAYVHIVTTTVFGNNTNTVVYEASYYFPHYDPGFMTATWNWGDGTSSAGTVLAATYKEPSSESTPGPARAGRRSA